jgi:signal transduction histidine kinase
VRSLCVADEELSHLADVLAQGEVVWAQPVESPRALPGACRASAALYLPLRRQDELIGIHVAVYRAAHAALSPGQERLARGMSTIGSMAFANARLLEELQQSNQDLQTALARAERSDRLAEERQLLADMRARFVTMASHEFRTPLATIRAAADVLDRYGDRLGPAQQAEKVTKIRTQVDHMTSLLEDVLSLGRAEAGRLPCEPERVRLHALCQDLLSQAQSTASATHRLVLDLAGAPSEALLDAKLVRQIIGNLLGNALKYSPHGGTVSLAVRGEQGNVSFRVSDQGIGITPEDQTRLFEPFHRGSNVGTIPGSGLGLAITQRATALHGGTLAVESTVGAGTSITVTLPATGS